MPTASTVGYAPYADIASGTLCEAATERMIDDIVHGRLKPGSKLGIDVLKRQYNMGASPLREGLTRLLALGFVTNESRKGFRVATVSYDDLVEITEVRKLIELRALELSIKKGGPAWEENIVVQMARLRHAVQNAQQEEDRHPSLPFDAVHEDFHRALISGCDSPRLIELQETYYNLAKRYRVIAFQHLRTTTDFLSCHEELATVVLGRQIPDARDALSQHLDLLINRLPEDILSPLTQHGHT